MGLNCFSVLIAIEYIATAIAAMVGIEQFPILAVLWNPDTIVMMRSGCQINDNDYDRGTVSAAPHKAEI